LSGLEKIKEGLKADTKAFSSFCFEEK